VAKVRVYELAKDLGMESKDVQSLPLKQNQRRRLQQRKLLLKKQLPMSWKRR